MELWKDVIGYEGMYEVSNYGKVKSIMRVSLRTNKQIGGDLKSQRVSKDGYLRTTLCKKSNKNTIKIHKIVANAFLIKEEHHTQVNHIDGDKKNNYVSNLEWCTQTENIRHSVKIGLRSGRKGEKCNFSKLKNKDVLRIRELSKEHTQNELADMFNTQVPNISRIINRKRWTHL